MLTQHTFTTSVPHQTYFRKSLLVRCEVTQGPSYAQDLKGASYEFEADTESGYKKRRTLATGQRYNSSILQKNRKPDAVIRKEISVVMAQLAKLSPESQQSLGSVLKKYAKKLGPEAAIGALWELIRIGDWIRAREAFITLRNQPWYEADASTHAHLIKVAGKAGELDEAVELFESMDPRRCKPTAEVYTALIDIFGKHGKVTEARSYFIEAEQTSGCEPVEETYCAFLRVLCKFGYMAEAEERFREMPSAGCLQDQVTFNIMIDGYGRDGNIEAMQLLFLEMCHVGLVPDSWTYNALIRSFGRTGRIEDMESCFENMQLNGCSPDHFTMQALIDGYARCGDLKKMKACLLHAIRQKYRLTLSAFNIAIDACGKAQDFDGVLKWFLKMKHVKIRPSVGTFSSMIRAYGMATNAAEVSRLFWQMKGMGLQPDLNCFNMTIEAFGNAGDMQNLESVRQEMESRGLEYNPSTYTELIVAYSKVGELHKMEEVFREMLVRRVRGVPRTYSGLMAGYSRVRDIKKVEDMWKKMVGTGIIPDDDCYQTLIQAYGRAGLYPEMEKTRVKMTSLGLKLDEKSLGAVVDLYASKGELSLMELNLLDMEEAGFVPKVSTLNKVISAYGYSGMVKESQSVFNFMIDKSVTPNPTSFLSLLEASGNIQIVENVLEPITLADSYKKLRTGPKSCIALLYSLSEVKSWDEALIFLSWMGQLENGRYRPLCRLFQQGYNVLKLNQKQKISEESRNDSEMERQSDLKSAKMTSGLQVSQGKFEGILAEDFLINAMAEAVFQDILKIFKSLHRQHKVPKEVEPFYQALVAAMWNFGLRKSAMAVVQEGISRNVITQEREFTGDCWKLNLNLLKSPVSGVVLLHWIKECNLLITSTEFVAPRGEVNIIFRRAKGGKPIKKIDVNPWNADFLDVLGRLNSPFTFISSSQPEEEESDYGIMSASAESFCLWVTQINGGCFEDVILPQPGLRL